VFTARYGLSPYIKQIRFVFKGLIKHYAIKLCGGVTGIIWRAFLTSVLDGGEWSASHTILFTCRGERPLPIEYRARWGTEPIWPEEKKYLLAWPPNPHPLSYTVYHLSECLPSVLK
jgi:hypothetical protein